MSGFGITVLLVSLCSELVESCYTDWCYIGSWAEFEDMWYKKFNWL